MILKNKKIIFVSLPSPFAHEPAMNPPLGILHISSYLKSQGYNNIELIDFALYKKYDYINETKYLEKIPLDGNIYGIYCLTPQYKWLKEISKYLKSNGKFVAVGGPHCISENCTNDGNIDFVSMGDGELDMYDFIRNGIIEKPTYSNKRIKNLDDMPMTDWDLIDLNLYKRTIGGERAAHIITLRGCPYNCHYCDRISVTRKVRYRSVDKVMNEVDYLRMKYNINSFVIYDDIFTLKKDRVSEFSNEFYKRNSKWRVWSRTDTITFELLTMMKLSGLQSITFGVESGSDVILKNINKKATRRDNKNALLSAKKAGVPVRCSLMYGNPGENKDTLWDTISLIEETQPDEWNLAILTPVPGSAFWSKSEDFGILFDKEWLKYYDYMPCNRFGDTGVGNSWVQINSMSKDEFINNLKWFIDELERVCPRKNIQDTIQEIKI